MAGLGTVGVGVVKILSRREFLAAAAGRSIDIVAVSARNLGGARGIDIGSARWEDDALKLATADDIDVVVELIGGAEGVA